MLLFQSIHTRFAFSGKFVHFLLLITLAYFYVIEPFLIRHARV